MNDTTTVARSAPGARETAAQSDAATRAETALIPPVDVIEDASGITLHADLPGVPRDKLALHVEADTLTIEGEVVIPMPEGIEPTYAEVSLPRFRRVFTLSKELDTGKVNAELKHGVLTLRIPKAEHAQPRRIDIRVA
ncbi:MAG: Hsp20/alpha crystallin family protein [Burkholderiales bacterium]